jgi:prepilin peptidase CpaA
MVAKVRRKVRPMPIVPAVLFSVFAALLLAAAVWDLASYTIPNRLTAALAGLALPAFLLAGLSPLEIGVVVGFGALVLACGMVLFALNVAGGGDVKLLAAAALWLGPQAGSQFVLWTAVAGGVLALTLVLLRRAAGPLTPFAPGWAKPLIAPGGPAPYGVAICAGGVLAWPSGVLAV